MSQSEKPPPPCVNMRRIAVNFIGSAGFNSPAKTRNKKTDQVINDEMVAATAATVLSSHCWPAVRPIDQSRLRHWEACAGWAVAKCSKRRSNQVFHKRRLQRKWSATKYENCKMFFARFIQFSFTACRSWTCPEDTEEGKSNLRSSAMKELVWLLAIVIPSVWSDDGFLTEPRKCQVDCAR